MLHSNAGRTVSVSPLLFDALSVALDAAERSGGAVDPTVGNAIAALGYDADLAEVQARPPAPPRALGRVAGYQHVQLNKADLTVRIPRGVRLDLGSSAKALAADRAAAHIASRVASGVLVSLGGDVAVAGPPPADGWAIGIARESSAPAEQVDQVVAIRQGGLASSATSVRSWKRGDHDVHHIVDPRTGDSVVPYWALVSATGASCVDANLVTTAAIVWGEGRARRTRTLRPAGPAGPARREGRLPEWVADGAGRGAMSSTMLWYATRASGLMALVLLTLTMVLGMTTTTRARARNWPGFAQQELHRRISMIAVVFLGLHVLTSVLDTFVNISWVAIVVPFTSSYSRFWVGVGAISLDLMLAVFMTSLLRTKMRPGTWRAVHWLAYLCWPVALAHTFGMGTDAGEGWVMVLGVVCVAAVVAALGWRLRTVARQSSARTARATVAGVPRTHLALTVHTKAKAGARHD